MQATVDSYGSILLGVHSGHHLLTLHRTENHPFHRHELLPDQALAAAGAEEALRGRVPAEVIVRHSLHFRVDGIVAPLTHHSMVLHIARLAQGLSRTITYIFPARMLSQSKQQKCFRCQFWFSAWVYSLLNISSSQPAQRGFSLSQ